MKPDNVLILPGWQNSGSDHWQSRWEAEHGYRRVDQHDWMTPKRGDWIARLEDVILGTDGPVVLVAHSLGCILTAAWAQVSRSTGRVQGALLVAPGDPEREELRDQLPSWSPIARQRLPFPSVLVGSRDDPYCDFAKAQSLADSWGSRFIDLGERGHINAESGLGDWPEGLVLLTSLLSESPRP
ncbi:RBBP9/YdeN family alpha/beta hydrolase [Hydrogenophaga sp. A37]|uniref:RBBP9/YdeN family alpha/beta hydrolase n=1 Tax=Hydrogenophaga sp. A37 TaxID=1945864 RepID=UPI0009852B58|nr:alpha/beta hydrolase [Hydrogenophaga sp. A37]OOG78787.1 alpha/beta hydrolase [Hydrogenophaga sp. A37]